jgi:hypothetical protein
VSDVQVIANDVLNPQLRHPGSLQICMLIHQRTYNRLPYEGFLRFKVRIEGPVVMSG